jgi:hypothetical protein
LLMNPPKTATKNNLSRNVGLDRHDRRNLTRTQQQDFAINSVRSNG